MTELETTTKPPLALRILPKGLRENVAAHLPDALNGITLFSEWYNTNQHFKYDVGDTIDCKTDTVLGYGDDRYGWRVTGHTFDSFTGDMYEIERPSGERQIHFKWNLENQFRRVKSADAERREDREDSSSAKNLDLDTLP